jgi:hypothetical protein
LNKSLNAPHQSIENILERLARRIVLRHVGIAIEILKLGIVLHGRPADPRPVHELVDIACVNGQLVHIPSAFDRGEGIPRDQTGSAELMSGCRQPVEQGGAVFQ